MLFWWRFAIARAEIRLYETRPMLEAPTGSEFGFVTGPPNDGRMPEVRLAVIGAGRWGQHWVRVCQQLAGARLSAVCDPDVSRVGLLSATCQVPWFERAEELFDRVKPDAVVIAAPTRWHAPLALQALDRGCHALVEKPLADNCADAARIAGHSGGRSMVGHLLRYHPAVVRMHELIERGELGRVTHILCDRMGGTSTEREETAWWALAPHDVSVMRYLLGAEPDSIHASSDALPGEHAEDAMTALLHFSGGVLGVVRTRSRAEEKVRRITVVGERRSVTFTDRHRDAALVHYESTLGLDTPARPGGWFVTRPGQPLQEERLPPDEPLRLQAQHFVDCLRSGRPFASSAEDGMRVVRVLEAGSRSLASGTTVVLADGWGLEVASRQAAE